MRRRNLSFITGVITIVALSGCASAPHNDVLIFGTETTLALDVGTSATNGGTPNITVGYKRDEAVWMPLVANGLPLEDPPPAFKLYQGEGESDANKDAYSVFASFGAQLEGKAGSAKVGLAQFFATGIAAQKLASNPASVLALTVKSPEQGAADADAVAAVAGDSAGTTLGKEILVKEMSQADKVLECMGRNGWKYYQVPAGSVDPSWGQSYEPRLSKIKTKIDLFRFYDDFNGTRSQMAAKTIACPT